MPKRNVKLDPRYDWIGQPDAISKIRPIRLRQVYDETEIERKYRLDREKLNQWNSRFWSEHNNIFETSKADFINENKRKYGILNQISPHDMSGFYRSFLDTRKLALANYNTEWYRRNASLILPAIKVNLIRFRRFFRR